MSWVSSITLPMSLMTMLLGFMPICWASLAWILQVALFAVDGDKELGLDQRVDDLQLLLTGVAGDMERRPARS